MPTNVNPNEVKDDATAILKVWTPNPDFKLKDVTLQQYQQDHDTLDGVLAELAKKDEEMAPLRNQRDDLAVKINANNTRVRSAIKGYFGPNSTEYELAGGTRQSEQKKPGVKAKKADKGNGAAK